MKTTNKIIAVICALTMLCTIFSISAVAARDVDYTITNPYENVDWSWDQYKADFHTHTNQSDGRDNLKDMLEASYAYDYDIYAITDHGTTNYSWTESNVVPGLKLILSVRGDNNELVCLDENGGYTFSGDEYGVETRVDENGIASDYYYQVVNGVKGHEMLRVPYGIENNPTSANNAHVNTWFVDYGNGIMGGTSEYETPINAIEEINANLGENELHGLSVINHPGEYTNARDEKYSADAYDLTDSYYSYCVDKFTSLLVNNPSCMGIDVNSKGDTRTRFDRKLWDLLLMNVVPTGRNVFGIATSDAHSVSAAFTGYTLMLMEENTVANLQKCMANGEFFAASRYIGNYDELREIRDYLATQSDSESVAMAETLTTMLDEHVSDQKPKYEASVDSVAPHINSITVNDTADTINIDVDNALCIRWIADGKTIAYGDEIDLDDYCNKIGSYVRAEIFGEGGIVYTQAFTLEYDEAPTADEDAGNFRDFGKLAGILPDTVVRFLLGLDIFAILYEAIFG